MVVQTNKGCVDQCHFNFAMDYSDDDILLDATVRYESEIELRRHAQELYELLLDSPFEQQGGAPVRPINELVTIEELGQKSSKKYSCRFRRFKVVTHDLEDTPHEEIPEMIHRILDHIIENVGEGVENHHRMRICMDARGLQTPIWTEIIQKDQLTADRWMESVS